MPEWTSRSPAAPDRRRLLRLHLLRIPAHGDRRAGAITHRPTGGNSGEVHDRLRPCDATASFVRTGSLAVPLMAGTADSSHRTNPHTRRRRRIADTSKSCAPPWGRPRGLHELPRRTGNGSRCFRTPLNPFDRSPGVCPRHGRARVRGGEYRLSHPRTPYPAGNRRDATDPGRRLRRLSSRGVRHHHQPAPARACRCISAIRAGRSGERCFPCCVSIPARGLPVSTPTGRAQSRGAETRKARRTHGRRIDRRYRGAHPARHVPNRRGLAATRPRR